MGASLDALPLLLSSDYVVEGGEAVMAISSNLGFPRIGRRRELKQLLESYWSGQTDAHGLESGAQALRLAHWRGWYGGGGGARPPAGG